jgi:hypothetical protein
VTRVHKIEIWAALIALVAIAIPALIYWQKQKAISFRGAVIVQDSDPRKQLPIAGVTISGGDLAKSDTISGPSGLFILKLLKPVRKGHPIVLRFRHPQYHPLDLNEFVSNRIYVVHLVPLSSDAPINQPQTKVTNILLRYTVDAVTELNVGSAVKTFEIENKGDVPCKGNYPCSPDGKWKAAVGSGSLDAGAGNEFRDARASCIAGPCPFTKIETDQFSQGGRTITVAARDWSDTATFVLEAEVFRPMVSQIEHWSYPVIFGEGLTFTLPASAESVSIEADLNGQTIIFPLGPSLFLSWATCDAQVNPDKARVYRCASKPGYSFH